MLAKTILCEHALFMHVVVSYVNQRITGLLSDFSMLSDMCNNIPTNNTILLIFFLLFLKAIL